MLNIFGATDVGEHVNLKGKVIVITGASSGLGAGMASWFLDHGARLGLCARRKPKLEGESVVSTSVDVRDLDALRLFAREVSGELGPVDLWINNAAVLDPLAPQRALTSSDLMDHLEVNVGGVLNGTKAFIEQLEADGHRGALVNITSGLAKRGRGGVSAYSAAKAGVDRLTEISAIEEGELLTMALAVSPGVIETPMQQELRRQDPDVLPDVEMFREMKESGTMNSPSWVASHIAEWVFGGEPPEQAIVRVPQEPA
ncbi:MAG: SDR family oxidoreductase [Acidimicrobiia bacterium]